MPHNYTFFKAKCKIFPFTLSLRDDDEHMRPYCLNPDILCMNDQAVAFVKAFVDAKKPITAICHGPWTLINAGGIKGYKVTSWPSLKIDLINAGAKWVDQTVVRDRSLVTSRKPADIPEFNKEMITLFARK